MQTDHELGINCFAHIQTTNKDIKIKNLRKWTYSLSAFRNQSSRILIGWAYTEKKDFVSFRSDPFYFCCIIFGVGTWRLLQFRLSKQWELIACNNYIMLAIPKGLCLGQSMILLKQQNGQSNIHYYFYDWYLIYFSYYGQNSVLRGNHKSADVGCDLLIPLIIQQSDQCCSDDKCKVTSYTTVRLEASLSSFQGVKTNSSLSAWICFLFVRKVNNIWYMYM